MTAEEKNNDKRHVEELAKSIRDIFEHKDVSIILLLLTNIKSLNKGIYVGNKDDLDIYIPWDSNEIPQEIKGAVEEAQKNFLKCEDVSNLMECLKKYELVGKKKENLYLVSKK